jgi:hypothetical protein
VTRHVVIEADMSNGFEGWAAEGFPFRDSPPRRQ